MASGPNYGVTPDDYSDKVRLCVTQAPVCPAISEIGLFYEKKD